MYQAGARGRTNGRKQMGRADGRNQGRANTPQQFNLTQQFHLHVAPISPPINDSRVRLTDDLKDAFEGIRTVAMSWRAKLDSSESRRMLGVVIEHVDRVYMVQNAPLWNK